MCSIRLQRNNFSSSKTSWRHLEDVLEDEKLLRWKRLQDVSWRRLGDKKNVYWGYLYLRNLNVYLTNLYFTNLYVANLRRIQNALEPNSVDICLILKHKQHLYFKNWNLWNRWPTKWGNKNKVLSNILNKYWKILKNCLYAHLYLQLNSIFILKKSSTFANLLMEKKGNWFFIVKMWEKHPKKIILRKGSASLLINSVWGSFQFSFLETKLLVSPYEEHRLEMSYSKQLMSYTKSLNQL